MDIRDDAVGACDRLGLQAAAQREACDAIEDTYYGSLAAPPDGIDAALARDLARDDATALQEIADSATRQRAMVTMGHVASQQQHYRAALELDSAEVATAVAQVHAKHVEDLEARPVARPRQTLDGD